MLSTGAVIGIAFACGVGSTLLTFVLSCVLGEKVDASDCPGPCRRVFTGQYTPGGVGAIGFLLVLGIMCAIQMALVTLVVGLVLGLSSRSTILVAIFCPTISVGAAIVATMGFMFWVWNQDWED